VMPCTFARRLDSIRRSRSRWLVVNRGSRSVYPSCIKPHHRPTERQELRPRQIRLRVFRAPRPRHPGCPVFDRDERAPQPSGAARSRIQPSCPDARTTPLRRTSGTTPASNRAAARAFRSPPAPGPGARAEIWPPSPSPFAASANGWDRRPDGRQVIALDLCLTSRPSHLIKRV